MPILDLMKQRCSVRKFQDRSVPRDTLIQVLEAARVAPSACNFQPWHFIVIEDQAEIASIAPPWVADSGAPALIVACGNHQQAWRRRDGKQHCDIDIAIAVDHMTLAATEVGLGTCWICSFDAFKCSEVLELPEQVEPIVLLPIGYPDEQKPADRHSTDRKPLDKIVTWRGEREEVRGKR